MFGSCFGGKVIGLRIGGKVIERRIGGKVIGLRRGGECGSRIVLAVEMGVGRFFGVLVGEEVGFVAELVEEVEVEGVSVSGWSVALGLLDGDAGQRSGCLRIFGCVNRCGRRWVAWDMHVQITEETELGNASVVLLGGSFAVPLDGWFVFGKAVHVLAELGSR